MSRAMTSMPFIPGPYSRPICAPRDAWTGLLDKRGGGGAVAHRLRHLASGYVQRAHSEWASPSLVWMLRRSWTGVILCAAESLVLRLEGAVFKDLLHDQKLREIAVSEGLVT